MADRYGLLDPGYRDDPYPALGRVREAEPVLFVEDWDCWIVTRYDDVLACFRDDRLSADRASGYAAKLPPPVRAKLAPLIGNFGRWILMLDPPNHTRLRALMSKAFTPRLVAELRPVIEQTCARALDECAAAAAAGDGSFDLIEHYAFPVPVLVIGAMLGLPPEDAAKLKRWSSALTSFLGAASMSQEIVGAALAAVVELETYFREQLELRRREPGEDLLSSLLAAHEDDDRLDEAELLACCTMILFGGHETTTNLIGNAVKVLLDAPEALAALRGDLDGRVEAAVEELLRFESPVMRMGRVAKQELELGGRTIAAGERVYMMLAAANRDPAHFAEPERLDLGRVDNRHLSFGQGRHYCLGAALGRLEGQIALTQLLRRFPGLQAAPAQPSTWLDNLTVRGLEQLQLRP